jgi:hypothetical protein
MVKKSLNLIIVIILGLTLAACGTDTNDVPSIAATPTAIMEEESLDGEAKVIAFTQCMRAHGIEYMDPVVDSKGNGPQPEFFEGVTYTREELAAPYRASSHHLEGLTFGQERENLSEQLVHFVELAACLRDGGYEVDDPTTETPQTWLIKFRVEYDWDDPEAMADYEECNREN